MKRCLTLYCVLLTYLFVGLPSHAGQLYIVSLKTGEIRQLTNDATRVFGSPDWSPDDKKIAFDTWPISKDLLTSEVAVIDSQGGPTQLLGHGAMPSWAPDGERFVCHTYVPKNQIVVANADGSGREVLLDQWGSPRWNSNGRTIALLYRGGLANFDFATGKLTTLIGNYGVSYGFSISPSGKRFCISLNDGGLSIVDYDSTLASWKVTNRLPSSSVTRRTSWSPDGKRVVVLLQDKLDKPAEEPNILFAGDRPQLLYQIYLLTVDDDSPPVRLPGIPLHWKCADADWSHDGEWIAFIRIDSGEPKGEKANDEKESEVRDWRLLEQE